MGLYEFGFLLMDRTSIEMPEGLSSRNLMPHILDRSTMRNWRHCWLKEGLRRSGKRVSSMSVAFISASHHPTVTLRQMQLAYDRKPHGRSPGPKSSDAPF